MAANDTAAFTCLIYINLQLLKMLQFRFAVVGCQE